MSLPRFARIVLPSLSFKAKKMQREEAHGMNTHFADTLRKLRIDRDLSQRELAEMMYVTRSTVARWENGSRLPDAMMMSRLAECLDVSVGALLAAAEGEEAPNVIMVDDRKVILTGGLPILEEVMPNATVVGFTRPAEAVEYAKGNRVALAFLDIELGKTSGLDLCRELLEINPRTNVVFLTAYAEYSLDAWDTGASGFMVKPITQEGVREQLGRLRYPFSTNANRERVSRSSSAKCNAETKTPPVHTATKEELGALTEGGLEEGKGVRLDLDDLDEAVGGRLSFLNIFNRFKE